MEARSQGAAGAGAEEDGDEADEDADEDATVDATSLFTDAPHLLTISSAGTVLKQPRLPAVLFTDVALTGLTSTVPDLVDKRRYKQTIAAAIQNDDGSARAAITTRDLFAGHAHSGDTTVTEAHTDDDDDDDDDDAPPAAILNPAPRVKTVTWRDEYANFNVNDALTRSLPSRLQSRPVTVETTTSGERSTTVFVPSQSGGKLVRTFAREKRTPDAEPSSRVEIKRRALLLRDQFELLGSALSTSGLSTHQPEHYGMPDVRVEMDADTRTHVRENREPMPGAAFTCCMCKENRYESHVDTRCDCEESKKLCTRCVIKCFVAVLAPCSNTTRLPEMTVDLDMRGERLYNVVAHYDCSDCRFRFGMVYREYPLPVLAKRMSLGTTLSHMHEHRHSCIDARRRRKAADETSVVYTNYCERLDARGGDGDGRGDDAGRGDGDGDYGDEGHKGNEGHDGDGDDGDGGGDVLGESAWRRVVERESFVGAHKSTETFMRAQTAIPKSWIWRVLHRKQVPEAVSKFIPRKSSKRRKKGDLATGENGGGGDDSTHTGSFDCFYRRKISSLVRLLGWYHMPAEERTRTRVSFCAYSACRAVNLIRTPSLGSPFPAVNKCVDCHHMVCHCQTHRGPDVSIDEFTTHCQHVPLRADLLGDMGEWAPLSQMQTSQQDWLATLLDARVHDYACAICPQCGIGRAQLTDDSHVECPLCHREFCFFCDGAFADSSIAEGKSADGTDAKLDDYKRMRSKQSDSVFAFPFGHVAKNFNKPAGYCAASHNMRVNQKTPIQIKKLNHFITHVPSVNDACVRYLRDVPWYRAQKSMQGDTKRMVQHYRRLRVLVKMLTLRKQWNVDKFARTYFQTRQMQHVPWLKTVLSLDERRLFRPATSLET
jgi:hypothetical protein